MPGPPPPPPPPPPMMMSSGGPPAPPPPISLNSGGDERAQLLKSIADGARPKLRKVDPSEIKDRSKPTIAGSATSSTPSSDTAKSILNSLTLCLSIYLTCFK